MLEMDSPHLVFLAAELEDLEKVRIAGENRLRQLTRSVEDKDGKLRGLGFPEDSAPVKSQQALVKGLKDLEHQIELDLAKAMRKHPLGPWVTSQHGVGDKMAARLLAAIGDPWWNSLHERPRTVAELWAYSGHHTVDDGNGVWVAPRRKRGEKGNWSDEARMRAHLIAEKIMMTGKATNTPGYQVYARARARYDGTVHPTTCVRCGPSGHPAKAGTPRSPGHCHAMALRAVAKWFLRNLWEQARELHIADIGLEAVLAMEPEPHESAPQRDQWQAAQTKRLHLVSA